MKAIWCSNSTDMIVEKCWSGFVVHRPSPSYVLNSILACLFSTIVGLIGTSLNSLVVFIFWKSQKMRKKISSMMIMVLSANDLAVVTIIPALLLLQSVTNIIGAPNCLYNMCYQVIGFSLGGISTITLLVMHINSYLAIVHPVFHRVAVTKKKYILILISLWFVAIVVTAVRVISPFLSNIILALSAITVVCMTLFMYVSIFAVAKKKLTKVDTINNNAPGSSKNFAIFKRELKLAKTYLLIVFICFACYFPAAVMFAIWSPLQNEKQTLNILINVYPWPTSLTVVMNSTLNCLVFFWSNRELRKEASKIVKTVFRRE